MKMKNLYLLVALTIVLGSCAEDETQIIIFHTNDSHAMIDNFPALAYLVNAERASGANVFLVSAGDIFSGNPMVDNFNPPGYPKIDLMNRLGYNLNTIGNHEFDYGVDVLAERIRQADFPFILANIDTGESGLPQPEPYYLARIGKRTIAFLGVVQVNRYGIPSTYPGHVSGMTFYPPDESAGNYEFLAGRADAVIGLTHHGFAADTLLAWQYPWFDAIIGGHSHTLTLNPRTYNNVLVTHAGSNLEYLGKVTLLFKGKELTGVDAGMIHLGSLDNTDEELAAIVEQYNDNPELNKVIGRLVTPLSGKPAIGCFVTDAYRQFGSFDLAFHNFGGIRVDKIEGDIRVRDIFEMDPFGNELISMELSYKELRDLIGNSLTTRKLPSVQISGATIEVHLTATEELEGVKLFGPDGNELDENGKYLTGMPSYMASAFNFERDDPGSGKGIITARVVIDHIIERGEIEYAGSERSRIIRAQGL